MKPNLINIRTKKQLDLLLKNPPQAIMLIAPSGSGKLTIANYMAGNLLDRQSIERLSSHPYLVYIKRPDGKQDIPIDSVRKLIKSLSLKVPGKKEIRRVIIVEDAQDMNEEAQNAMLKILEEPPSDCVFILTADSQSNLLPTIVSRTQEVFIQPINLNQALSFYEDEFTNKQVGTAWSLSQGSAGLLSALLMDDKDHPLKQAVDSAKEYLKKDTYERLMMAEKLSKDKNLLKLFLEALLKLLAALHRNAVEAGKNDQQRRLLTSRKLVNRLQDALDNNVSPKLITLELTLNLL